MFTKFDCNIGVYDTAGSHICMCWTDCWEREDYTWASAVQLFLVYVYSQAPIRTNCDDTVTYHYGLDDTYSNSTQGTYDGIYTDTTQSTSVIFYLDGYQMYNFSIKVENSVGFSESEIVSRTSAQLGKECKLD